MKQKKSNNKDQNRNNRKEPLKLKTSSSLPNGIRKNEQTLKIRHERIVSHTSCRKFERIIDFGKNFLNNLNTIYKIGNLLTNTKYQRSLKNIQPI